MRIIDNSELLDQALDPPDGTAISRLLAARADLIDLATFVIVEAGDTLQDIETAAGVPIATNLVDGARFGDLDFVPSFEWVQDHGDLYEAPVILSDDGAGIVFIVPDCLGVDATLLALLRAYAEPADANSAD
ncbi:hypothetical protein [uncultured Sphingomonas sp.]|uniref:hypothetical protein n=1 Tax=uncultured Sphingomonas sp. TaxID=158754 RepID=UPI0025E3ACF7|nr:hypothetical protein [uncultured Sphingomonas sp.]